ncbi:DUF6000 family protein [Actinomycetota bacterium Odt1-20B]
MSTDRDEAELRRLRRRYVAARRRYLRLNHGIFRLTERRLDRFARELARTAHALTPRELGILLDSGWRERKTAAWLIAIAGRTEFRPRLGKMLLADEMPFAGHAYCITLATFGTEEDADLLSAYLDRYLARPDLDYDQVSAIGALLHLDDAHGSDRAARFLAPGGPWQQWVQVQPARREVEPVGWQETMTRFCAFVQEAARHYEARRA